MNVQLLTRATRGKILLVVFMLTCVVVLTAYHVQAAKPAGSHEKAPVPFMPPPDGAQTSAFVVQNNDIDLYTNSLYHIVRRWRSGEAFEPLPELRDALKESPEIPSTHFWVAARLFNMAMMDSKTERYDEEIDKEFNACLVRAKRAKALPKFKHAGMYYEAMCKGGLGAHHFMRKRYVKAGVLFRECIQEFVELHEQRPEHLPTVFVLGSYHYNTSRMGTLGKLVLRLLALPVGDRATGMRMLMDCAKPGNPVDVLSRLTLIDAFQYHEDRLADALAMAKETVAMLPQHSGMMMLGAELQMMHGYLPETGAFLERTRRLLPPANQMDALPEFKDRAEWLVVLDAFYRLLTAPDEKSRDTLITYGFEGKSENENIKVVALTLLGHALRIVDLDKQADATYELAVDADGAQFLRDRAQDYREKRDISDQISISPGCADALRAVLSARPLPP